MTLRRKLIVWPMLALIGAVSLCIVFCPRPALFGDIRFSAAVTDSDGRLLRLALAEDDRYRLHQPLESIAESAVEATVLYEDRFFRAHPGFNVAALFRAAWSTYVQRDRVIGGSTITMQLARLRFALDTRSIAGKMRQIARAVQLERHYSKDQILEAYLNLAPYGGNIEGIGTASLVYFDKPAAQLSLPESLALAVIAQNPGRRNPATPSGYRQLMSARKRLAEIWIDRHGMSADARAQIGMPLAVREPADLPYLAPHFSREILSGLPHRSGIITTTLRWPLQRLLQQQVEAYAEHRRSAGIDNASAMLLDYRSMEVLASVGSADFFNHRIQGQVDGTRAKRSPGSTLKPFVYGLAIDQGIIHPMTLLKDAPKRYAAYTPENFDRGFLGPVVAQDALIYSRNVPAIDLLSQIGLDTFHALLTEAGVAQLKKADHYGLAMVLGGNELTMQELLRLYAMLANGGRARPLVSVQDSRVADDGPQLLTPEASFLVLDMLRNNPRPDAIGLDAATARPPIAWKTGTSYAFRDAWTVGVVGPYVLAVWVGNFDGGGNPSFVGRTAAAPLFFRIADALPEATPTDRPDTEPAPQLNVRKVDVCASTGDLPGRYCPRTRQSWFIPGVSPIKVSDVHRSIRIDNDTGMRSCSFDVRKTHQEVFEIWPSDISRLFRKAGIAVRSPPPWADDCSLDSQAASGNPPQITSPSARLTYLVRPDRNDEERLPLTATTDGDVRWLYWFANDSFIAKVARDEPLFWRPQAGKYRMLAVDDLGRSNSRELLIK